MDVWDENKPVLAKLGVALFEAQSLEAILVNLYAISANCDEAEGLSSLQELLGETNSNQVLKKLEYLFLSLELPPELMPSLHRALVERNWLLHHFYFEFGRAIYDDNSGSAHAISTLEQVISLLSQLVVSLNELLIDRQLAAELADNVVNQRLNRSVDVYLGRRELL